MRRRLTLWSAFPLTVVVVFTLLGITAALAGGGMKSPSPDPDQGLTDAQRLQARQAIQDQFDQRVALWKRGLDTKAIAWDSVLHSDLNASYLPPIATLSDAKAKADLIVVVSGTSVTIAGDGGTVVTATVEKVLKGSAPTSLKIREAGGPMPTSDWKGVMIADALDAPILLPKHRAILFLMRSGDGTFTIQSFTGMYELKGGHVIPLQLNPFGESVRGMPEAGAELAMAS